MTSKIEKPNLIIESKDILKYNAKKHSSLAMKLTEM